MTYTKGHPAQSGAGDPLTLDDVSRRTGEPASRLLEWRDAGLIGHDGAFTPEDIGRVHLIHDMLHRGHDLPSVAQAFSHPDGVFQQFLANMGDMLSRPVYTLGEAAELVGLDVGTARRVMDACGVQDPGDTLTVEDVECLKSCKVVLDTGYPEEALLQILHVYADAMDRAAEVGARTTHFHMHQRLKGGGMPADEVMRKLNDALGRIEPLVEPALMYFYRKGQTRATWDDMLMHLEEEAGLVEPPDTPGQIRQAVMFVDLASFTPLAEAMGDLKAAEVVERFSQIVRSSVRPAHGRIVKQIGDAFMIVFPGCYSALGCVLWGIERRASAEPQFPAVRCGLHWGPVLYREGDYFGSNVNIAARLAAEAERHQVLVTDEVRRRARELDYVEFIPLGHRRLKGLASEVDVFEARLVTKDQAPAKVADPVCGMELGPAEVVARLTWEGRERVFCSDDCLRKFVAAPEKYL